MTPKSLLFVLFVVLAVLLTVSFSMRNPSIARVAFISDLHASIDGKDRSLIWTQNDKGRLREIFSTDSVRPTHVIWTGDLIDFLPAEWDIVTSWIRWISRDFPSVDQHAVMGNHDYIYNNYPEINSKFNSPTEDGYRRTEVESFLTSPVKQGETELTVRDAAGFVEGSQLLLIQTPARDTTAHYYIGLIKHIDPIRNVLELGEPVNDNFPVEYTAVRQGYTEQRGIAAFLTAFAGTKTTSTRSLFTIGNTCFILFSMDQFYNFDDHSIKTRALSEDDFHWLDSQLSSYQKTHNIVVVSHEMPDSGAALGGIHDPTNTVDFNQSTRSRLMALVEKYPITAWISGHTHPDARQNVVHSLVKQTHFVLVPPLGIGAEGQVLVLTLRDGATSMDFEYWSTDKQAYFGRVNVPTRFPLRGEAGDAQF